MDSLHPCEKRRDCLNLILLCISNTVIVMKRCSKCKKSKSYSEFNFKYKKKNVLQSHCRECSRAELVRHYHEHKSYYLEKAHKRNKRIRDTLRTYVWSYLSKHPCVDCGEKDPIVLEFDHISEKADDISALIRKAKLKKLESEISKCEVRCANCHRRVTAKRAGWSKKLPL